MDTEISKTKATTGVIMDINPMKYKEIVDKENEGFVGEQRKQTNQIIQEQDKDLEQLGKSVDRLGMI